MAATLKTRHGCWCCTTASLLVVIKQPQPSRSTSLAPAPEPPQKKKSYYRATATTVPHTWTHPEPPAQTHPSNDNVNGLVYQLPSSLAPNLPFSHRSPFCPSSAKPRISSLIAPDPHFPFPSDSPRLSARRSRTLVASAYVPRSARLSHPAQYTDNNWYTCSPSRS
ncbi:hypothetical protein BGW36DRAFT_192534 [Talaromyces proteolyticus]|uniref:Uncharacterized protein n=1 Tax=Talaromyces proteolyticus TaxID=1131652 RepID=A0AAD4PUA5_9EURO|nr:uncharacterized protein BGW36DRAFT_192534 [Talaromyces proteolyticus]KAH8694886.1 hypothetical protein BGW36DRAFT_192534 [Talaromyces proteolyticus]